MISFLQIASAAAALYKRYERNAEEEESEEDSSEVIEVTQGSNESTQVESPPPQSSQLVECPRCKKQLQRRGLGNHVKYCLGVAQSSTLSRRATLASMWGKSSQEEPFSQDPFALLPSPAQEVDDPECEGELELSYPSVPKVCSIAAKYPAAHRLINAEMRLHDFALPTREPVEHLNEANLRVATLFTHSWFYLNVFVAELYF